MKKAKLEKFAGALGSFKENLPITELQRKRHKKFKRESIATALASEKSLAKNWLSKKDNKTWKHL